MPYKFVDLRKVHTYPLIQRKNLVKMKDLIQPDEITQTMENPALIRVVELIKKAHQDKRPIIWMMGAHVIKNGLGLILVDLMKHGFVSHIAGNGAVGIHDFELALIGETSKYGTSIEDGTFGMAEETGALIHQALKED